MESDNTTPAASGEPLLGAPPTLSDQAWGDMLNSAFEAPPGYADGIVDFFDAPEDAGDEIDVDDHTIDFDGLSGGEGVASGATDGEDSLIDPDAADPDPTDQDEPATDHAPADDYGFGVDAAAGPEFETEAESLDDLSIDTSHLDGDDHLDNVEQADTDGPVDDLSDASFDSDDFFN